jgi:predicted dehydrogenase
MEPGLDWDMWLGPGPVRPYSSVLSPRGVHDHFPDWRLYKEYGGGAVCDWGAHHLDIAQWGLGMDESGPVQVQPPADPKATSGGVLTYANGIRVIHNDSYGIDFHGSDGEVKVNRGKFEFYLGGKKIAGHSDRGEGTSLPTELSKAEDGYLKNAKVKLYVSQNHTRNFLDCMRSRKKPITNEEVGGRSAICCHLLNQAYYNHATIHWKPKPMKFARDGGKPEWLAFAHRAPWTVA